MIRSSLLAVAVAVLCMMCPSSYQAFAVEKQRQPEVLARQALDPDRLTKIALFVTTPLKLRLSGGLPPTMQQRLVEEHFTATLTEKNYDVLVRSDLEAVLKEQGLQAKFINTDNASEAGRLLNASAVMLVDIPAGSPEGSEREVGEGKDLVLYDTDTARLSVRLIDTNTHEVLWKGSHYVEILTRNDDPGYGAFVAGQKSFPSTKPDLTNPSRGDSKSLIKVSDELSQAFPVRKASLPLTETARQARMERGRTLAAELSTGSVWQGTHTSVEDDTKSISVKWVVKERSGEKFSAEIEMPRQTLKVDGTVLGGIITWRARLADGRSGPGQTARIRGRAITGRITRKGQGEKVIESTLLLTLK